MKSKCCNSNIIVQEGTKFCSHCISICKSTKDRTLIIFAILVVVSVFIYNNVKAPNTTGLYSYEIIQSDIIPNDINILTELVKNKCILPNVALAQSKLETGNFTSNIAVENKNLFGIKKHKCKYVTGEKRNHATYDSYKDNIACYVKIQNKYLKSIENKYAEDVDYLTKLKQIK